MGKGSQHANDGKQMTLWDGTPAPEDSIIQSGEWSGFVQMRKKLRKPLTDRAVEMALRRLEQLAPGRPDLQRKILDQSTYYCWLGLFPLRDETARERKRDASYEIGELEAMIASQPILPPED